jgi:antirestriction protein ArdC
MEKYVAELGAAFFCAELRNKSTIRAEHATFIATIEE